MTDQPTSPPAPENADPSMEEILASIRRILNDDDASAPPPVSTAAAEPAAEDDVLMLDDSMMVSPHEPRQHDAETAENISEAEAAEPMVRDALTTAPTEGEWPGHEAMAATSPAQTDFKDLAARTTDLLAPEAAAAAASSVGSLVRTLAAGRATRVYGGGPTLEDIVRAELRPLLKEWLDTNLPSMVERLVRAEIERVVGRCVP
jgi:uncharacterized protein